jgi:transcription elongation factor GreA
VSKAMEKVPMTVEGFQMIEAELHRLKAVERPRIIQQISDAREHGDLSENAEYHAAKDQQGITEARVADLEDKLSRADIIDVSKLKGDQVMFGATVTLVDEDTDDKAKYRIVGEIEANVKQGRISITSPLARALLGKRKKDVVEVSTPGGGKSYKVLKVEFK